MENVLTVFRFTLAYAEKLLDGIEAEQMTQLPHQGMNHPSWIIGHYALGSDLVAQLLGHDLLTDDDWMQQFGPGSTPVDASQDYPPKEELLDMVRRTHARAIELMETATVEQLGAPNETPFFPDQFPTVGDLLTHLLSTHAAMHLGQLSAWRRCVGLPSVLGI